MKIEIEIDDELMERLKVWIVENNMPSTDAAINEILQIYFGSEPVEPVDFFTSDYDEYANWVPVPGWEK